MLVGPALEAQTDQQPPEKETSGLINFMNRLPLLVNQDLPFLVPGGTYWFYARPHFGDPFSGNYFRLDGGIWFKLTDHLDLNFGAQGYIWSDENANDATRYGFYGANTGIKYARPILSTEGSAFSVGANYSSPVGRPPLNLVDGMRHLDPYVTYTRPLVKSWKLVGFSSLGLDFMSHSAQPQQFSENVLHTNSINFSVGVSRQWQRFVGSVTLSGATTEFMSREGRQVVTLNPQVFVPLFARRLPRWHLIGVLGLHANDGPDGHQFGANAAVNINFKSKP
jgi:hypothetical protein